MTIPRLPTIAEEIGPGLQQFTQGMHQLLNPNEDIQNELKKRLAIDPELRQKLIDEEFKNPGFIKNTFGGKGLFPSFGDSKVAYLGEGTASTAAQGQKSAAENPNQDLSQLANTPLGQSTSRVSTGDTTYKAKQGASNAIVANAEAKNADQLYQAHADLAQVEATHRKSLLDAQLPYMNAIAQAQGMEAAKKVSDETTTGLVEANPRYQTINPKTGRNYNIAEDLYYGTGALNPNEISALYSKPEYIQQTQKIHERNRDQVYANIAAARNAHERRTALEMVQMQSAENTGRAYLANGIPGVDSGDLLQISQQGFGPRLSAYLANPTQFSQQDPQAAAVITQHPNWVSTWQAKQAGDVHLKDKVNSSLLKSYQSDYDKVEKMVPNIAPDAAQSLVETLLPTWQMLRDNGVTTLPKPAYGGSPEFFGLKAGRKLVGIAAGKIASNPTQPLLDTNPAKHARAAAIIADYAARKVPITADQVQNMVEAEFAGTKSKVPK